MGGLKWCWGVPGSVLKASGHRVSRSSQTSSHRRCAPAVCAAVWNRACLRCMSAHTADTLGFTHLYAIQLIQQITQPYSPYNIQQPYSSYNIQRHALTLCRSGSAAGMDLASGRQQWLVHAAYLFLRLYIVCGRCDGSATWYVARVNIFHVLRACWSCVTKHSRESTVNICL